MEITSSLSLFANIELCEFWNFQNTQSFIQTRLVRTDVIQGILGPGWKGAVPQGVSQISSPNNSVLVIGRVLVDSDSDLPTAYGLAKQIQLSSLAEP